MSELGLFSLTQLVPFRRTRDDANARPANGGLKRCVESERRQLLEDISSFLLRHDLAVNPANLAFAWEAFSGTSPGLYRRIAARAADGERITQAWIDEIAAEHGAEAGGDDLRAMLAELDQGVRKFTQTATAARNATQEYSTDLDRHVVELEDADRATDRTARLAALARAMAERTRRAEADLREREREAKTLRRRLDKAIRDAEHDSLTGLPNRRAFEAAFARLSAEAAATGQPLSLAFCDIDHFKQVNDTHGHDVGDDALRAVAACLRDMTRYHDVVARLGGEEFAVVAPNMNIDMLTRLGERIRRAIADIPITLPDNTQIHVTSSVGLAVWDGREAADDLFRRADQQLYQAKRLGRNRVCA